MKQVDCNVIKDLLPSYCDKVTSNVTNNLVEEHLSTCKDCSSVLKDMTKQIDIEINQNQSEQIDYLRKYKKNKIITIIFAIILTIIIILATFISLYIFAKKAEFFVDVVDLSISLSQKDNINGKENLLFEISDKNYKYDLKYYRYEILEDTQSESIYFRIVGKYSFGDTARNYFSMQISEKTNHIYRRYKR